MERVILHSDLNNFYASVECLYNPELRNKAVVVTGDLDKRHGIVLAKNNIAKAFKINTGDTVWEAQQKCKGTELVLVQANFERYLKFSRKVRAIYEEYSDRVESFGIDECWIDVTESTKIFGTGEQIANTIRNRIRDELGITASIGVSFNKIFAKLGSDLKKPDATTVISKENYKQKIYPLPAKALLYVGRATNKKLSRYGIKTIGDIANYDRNKLVTYLGKWGEYLWIFANGLENSPVTKKGMESVVKSVGNSKTAHRDLTTLTEIKMMITVMSESVAERLREQNLKGDVVAVSMRSTDLITITRQKKIAQPTNLASVIIQTAMALIKENWNKKEPLRSVGVKVSGITVGDNEPYQMDLFNEFEKNEKGEKIEQTMDKLRKRFGHYSIRRGTVYLDEELTNMSPKDDNTIHPYSFF